MKKLRDNDNMKAKLLILFLFLLLGTVVAQQKTKIALLNATAHIGNGKVIETSLITIENEKITSVSPVQGIKLNYSSFDTVIDLSGKHVYPALINTNNILGLHDAEAV